VCGVGAEERPVGQRSSHQRPRVTAQRTEGIVGTILSLTNTAAAPDREVEAVVRSPTNMAAAKIAAVDFHKMTSK